MTEYELLEINALGDARTEYIEEDSDTDAIEAGKDALREECGWQRTSADETTRVYIVVIPSEIDSDPVFSETRFIHPRLPKCYGPFHRFVRVADKDGITDACSECGTVRKIILHDDEANGPLVSFSTN